MNPARYNYKAVLHGLLLTVCLFPPTKLYLFCLKILLGLAGYCLTCEACLRTVLRTQLADTLKLLYCHPSV